MPIKHLLLWRHAEAEIANAYEADAQRVLSAKGLKQAKRMAKWLKRHMPKSTVIISSPALRAMQTADALKMLTHTEDVLRPEATVQEVIQLLSALEAESVLLVGHQPWLGQLATHALGIKTFDCTIKKGATWWLRRSDVEPNYYNIYTVQIAQQLD